MFYDRVNFNKVQEIPVENTVSAHFDFIFLNSIHCIVDYYVFTLIAWFVCSNSGSIIAVLFTKIFMYVCMSVSVLLYYK